MNLRIEKGREMIKFIEENYISIGCESSRIRSKKKREFLEYEKRLMNYFLELFDYHCTIANQRMVNKVMTLLKYDGYSENNKRFRYYLENVLKNKRKMGLPVRASNRKIRKLNRNHSENDTREDHKQDALYNNPVFSNSYVQQVADTRQTPSILSSPFVVDFALYDSVGDLLTIYENNRYLLDEYLAMNKENQNVFESANSVCSTLDNDIWRSGGI